MGWTTDWYLGFAGISMGRLGCYSQKASSEKRGTPGLSWRRLYRIATRRWPREMEACPLVLQMAGWCHTLSIQMVPARGCTKSWDGRGLLMPTGWGLPQGNVPKILSPRHRSIETILIQGLSSK